MRHGLKAMAAGVALALVSWVAQGTMITLDSTDLPQGGLNNTNFVTAEGMRVSPNCHYDVAGYIGFDSAGCGQVFNPEFLGPTEWAGVALWVDYLGQPFSLTSINVLGIGANWLLQSSNGGLFDAQSLTGGPGTIHTVAFAGADWTGIKWLLFTAPDSRECGAPGCTNFYEITISVPEPGTLALLGLGLAGLCLVRRRV